jgi:hypothetical protein
MHGKLDILEVTFGGKVSIHHACMLWNVLGSTPAAIDGCKFQGIFSIMQCLQALHYYGNHFNQ